MLVYVLLLNTRLCRSRPFICSTLNSCYEYSTTESCPEAKDSGRCVNREESQCRALSVIGEFNLECVLISVNHGLEYGLTVSLAAIATFY